MSTTKEEKNKLDEEGVVDDIKDDNLQLLQDILKTNKEILKSNKEIAASSSFIKKFIRNRIIIITIKWVLVVAVLVLGFMSLTSVFDYVRENLDYYEEKANKVTEFIDKADDN